MDLLGLLMRGNANDSRLKTLSAHYALLRSTRVLVDSCIFSPSCPLFKVVT